MSDCGGVGRCLGGDSDGGQAEDRGDRGFHDEPLLLVFAARDYLHL